MPKAESVNLQLPVAVVSLSDGALSLGRAATTGEQYVSQVHAPYAESSTRGNIFFAYADNAAAITIWSTEAATGGPLLWNGSSGSSAVNAVILGVGMVTHTAGNDQATGAMGFTGGYGQTAAPTSTTAIDSTHALNNTSTSSQCTAYRFGTTGTNRYFMPLFEMHSGAVTVETAGVLRYFDVKGMITVPPDSFVSLADKDGGDAWRGEVILIWEEIPIS